MNELARVIREFADLCEARGIVYAIMGGLAVRSYGIPRPTYDLDFTMKMAREDLPEFLDEVLNCGYTVPDAYRTGWVDEVAGLPLIKLKLHVGVHGVDVDIFLAESPFQQSILDRRRREVLDGRGVWLVSPEDLVLLKLLAGRTRDLADIQDVLFTQGQLDETYLEDWASRPGVEQRLHQVLSKFHEE